ncbi:hypothetical protein [Phytoactinopolyspora halotolerans]|nr:hypothetical protein [Phytoactinopolyspora halotolerans]
MDNAASNPSVLDQLLEPVELSEPLGEYDATTQTWSHRNTPKMSPQKHHQEQ